ncbi:hypothetical protein QA584_10985 [Anaerocolumna sp. AGMB13025]|uniref:hypothetical protein n=1 Tax=Anaerocolumna sp. AGMB13025 TaxID=3039116 RepID=UPI0024201D48|nr:hypothetical protein [Anaerocolumna sp. AGMB13025]WFR59587.1 hypothetical protein QA584_10985 [Anaerocolumna sp. AGMB13025]
MDQFRNSKGTPTKRTSSKNRTGYNYNYDYDYNTEYGDGDLPDIDKPSGLFDETEYSEETDE